MEVAASLATRSQGKRKVKRLPRERYWRSTGGRKQRAWKFPKMSEGGCSEKRMPTPEYGRAGWWGRKGCPTQHRKQTPSPPPPDQRRPTSVLGPPSVKNSWLQGRPTTTAGRAGDQFSSVAHLCPPLCRPCGLQHARLPCPSPTPGACSSSCPPSW